MGICRKTEWPSTCLGREIGRCLLYLRTIAGAGVKERSGGKGQLLVAAGSGEDWGRITHLLWEDFHDQLSGG